MMRKRSRPSIKDPNGVLLLLPDSPSETSFSDAVRRPRNTSRFSLPGLFVGFGKVMADADAARSPISPLDCRVFSGLGGHFARSPRSPGVDGPRKCWDRDGVVGLGLLDSLADESRTGAAAAILGSPRSCRNILLGSQMKVGIPSPKSRLDHHPQEAPPASPKSLPKNYVISPHRPGSSSETAPEHLRLRPPPEEAGAPGKIQSCSANMDGSMSCRRNLSFGAIGVESLLSPLVGGTEYESSSGSPFITHGFVVGSLSAGDIELSEDYTCIISHGPNPKTTHIFGHCILQSHSGDLLDGNKQGETAKEESSWMVKCPEEPLPFPSEDFLSACYSCRKKLEGKDIYIYRGEKAFCSSSCRAQEIMIEEGMGEPAASLL